MPAEFERFTDNAKRSLQNAGELAASLGAAYVGTEHLLLGVLKQNSSLGSKILKEMGVTLDKLNLSMVPTLQTASMVHTPQTLSATARMTVTLALRVAQEFGQPYAGTEHLLFAILGQENARANVLLRGMKIEPSDIRAELENYLNADQHLDHMDQLENETTSARNGSNAGRSRTRGNRTPTLDHFGIDLTARAEAGELDPVIGRVKQIDRMIAILNRRSKNNPVLIGEPGVGKTAIVEGLAQRIIAEEGIPEMLMGKRVVMLDMASIIAGTKYRGEFEDRLKKLIAEAKAHKEVILFIDELHTVVGAGSAEGAIDAANILKPALSRGEVQTIGATTLEEYRKHIEKDTALERRFQPVIVPETTVEETIAVLKGLRSHYEDFHKVSITDDALEDAAKLAQRYVADRFMPDKAIDLIDEAASLARIRKGGSSKKLKLLQTKLASIMEEIDDAVYDQNFEQAAKLKSEASILEEKISTQLSSDQKSGKIFVGSEEIAAVVSQMTGVPLTKLIKTESESLVKLERVLKRRIIGQNEAVAAVAHSIRRSRTGIADANRPIGSFIFLGPTGVGKTELAKALAGEVLHDKDALIKVDMSEFMERHNVARLVGAPAGYVGYDDGGQLTEKVRRKPYSLILFDEIEKAHPEVFNMLLQVLEDGFLTDAKGRKVDFRNTIIIMTSNVGAKLLHQEAVIGFSTDSPAEEKKLEVMHERMEKTIHSELKKSFRPEFLNRIDHIVIFKALSKLDVRSIVDLQLKNLAQRLLAKGIGLSFTASLKGLLIDKGYEVEQGARPMRRAIQRMVEDKLALAMLEGSVQAGDNVKVGAKGNEVTLSIDRVH